MHGLLVEVMVTACIAYDMDLVRSPRRRRQMTIRGITNVVSSMEVDYMALCAGSYCFSARNYHVSHLIEPRVVEIVRSLGVDSLHLLHPRRVLRL